MGILVLTLVVLGVYLPSVHYPFVFDDQLFLLDDNVRLGRWQAFLWPPAPRLLTWYTFVLQYRWHGPAAGFYHAWNVVLHLVNCILVFSFLKQIFRRAQPGGSSGPGRSREALARPRLLAWLGALFFALHPVQTEPVFYVYQRSTLLAAGFALAALLSHQKGRHWLTVVCFLLAVLSKEFMLVLPLALWGMEAFLEGRSKPSKPVLVCMILSLSLVWLHWVVSSGPGQIGAGSLVYAVTQVNVLWSYLGLIVFPRSLNLDWHVGVPDSLNVIWMAKLSLWLALVGSVFGFRKRWPMACFFLLLFLLFLLPTSSVVPSLDYMFEHRLYAGLAGWAGLLSLLVGALLRFGDRMDGRRSRSWLRIGTVTGLIAGFTLYGMQDLARGRQWSDRERLWRDTVSKSPAKYRPNYNLGVALLARAPHEAVRYLARAITIDPTIPLAYRSLGEAYLSLGEEAAAQWLWQKALELEPGHPETHLALGRLYLRQRDFWKAREHLEAARSSMPYDWRAHYYLAQLSFLFGFVQEAISHCEAGLSFNPDRSDLRLLLADAVAQTANWKRAIELYQQVLKADPSAEGYYKLGWAYWGKGSGGEAMQSVRQGVRLSRNSMERSRGESLLASISAGPPD